KKILVIGCIWPEPASSAAGQHMMQLLDLFLAQGWKITFASTAVRSEYAADLSTLGIDQQDILVNCDSFNAWLATWQPDIVVFDRFMTEEQFGWRVEQVCPHALRVLNSEDLHALRDARHRLLKKPVADNTAWAPALDPQCLFDAMAATDIAQREIAAIFRCDLSLMVSDFEIALLQDHFNVPAALLCHCPFMLDPPDANHWNTFESRRDFVSIGTFMHAPNRDAVRYLKQTLWPSIRKQLPDARLFIYGSYAAPQDLALHNPREGFHVPGRAEDALQVMSAARVCLAPLRFGAGIKGKLAEAMLCGTPSVTTSIGAEAMHGELAWSGVVADDAQAFADAAVALHEQQADWQIAQHNGLQILAGRFDKDVIGARVVYRLQDMAAQLDTHRHHNFIGSMLRHHLHKSTHYMSRWIEAKNRLPKNT
ncbi:MAG TPA: glycosyltransferase, partial [Pseudomonadales bacterium]|nr:glycosyltransferase [Pseudomonadales bacterium]